MGRWIRSAAAIAAVLTAFAAHSRADDAQPFAVAKQSSTTFEASTRVRLIWTEIAFRGNKPKAWDEITSPELRTSIRLQSGLFEGKLELASLEDLFARHPASNTRSLRAELQAGMVFDNWAVLAEWKPRDIFAPGFDDFLTGLNSYDIKLRDRFAMPLMPGMAPAATQATIAFGYVASTPNFYRRDFVELEVELVQRLSSDFAVTIAPKLELGDYLDFPGGEERNDATFSLRIIPAANLGNGLTVSVEGQATIAVSTRDTKTGESWALTPILKLQKAL
jgi:hypothetical protein